MSDDTIGALAGTLWGWSQSGVKEKEARGRGSIRPIPRLNRVMALADELIDTPRHLSQHVGGFLITRSRIDEVVPVENAAMEDRTVIEWNKDDLETLRLLKVDVLGLGMLSCLRRGLDLLRIHYGRTDTVPDLLLREPDEDERAPVYRMIQRADTLGTFQIESRAQMSMLPRLRPERFYDLVIEVAIVRPGPIQGKMVHPYLQRREALRERGEEPDYVSPGAEHGDKDELKAILKETLGIPLFQEQAMRIAMVGGEILASRSERACAARWRRSNAPARSNNFPAKKFIDGMTARGYDAEFAASASNRSAASANTASRKPRGELSPSSSTSRASIKCYYPDVFARRCSTASRWASTPRRKSCATQESMASRCGRPT